MTELTVFIPSRGRPDSAVELGSAFRQTCMRWTEAVFLLDEDDPALPEYRDRLTDPYVRVVVQPAPKRRGMVEPLNRAVKTEMRGWAVGFMGDDHRPRTEGWDQKFLESMSGRHCAVVYGNDLWQGVRIPTHVVMLSRMVDALGYMCPPQFQHLYVDRIWKDWGDRLSRRFYLPDVIVEHMHPDAGKALYDEHYEAVNNSAVANADKLAYEAYLAFGLVEDVNKLRRSFS